MLKSVNFFLMLLLAVLIPIAYTPNIYLDHSLYVFFSNGITLLLGLIFGLTFFYYNILHKTKLPNLLKRLAGVVSIIGVEFLIFYAGGLNYNLQDLISLVAVVVALYVGCANNFSEKQIKGLIVVFCVFSIVLGYLSIDTYVGGFSVYVDDYLVEGKNQIGQLVALCVILSFCLFFFAKRNIYKALLCITFVLSFFFLLVIKCKTAIIASFAVMCFIFFKLSHRNTKQKVVLIGIPIVLMIGLFFYDNILSNVLDIVGLSGKSSMEEISTGRASRNDMAIEYTFNNPILGELKHYSHIPLIHNWILLRIVRLGLIFSLPFVLFYLYILFYSGKRILKNKEWEIKNLGFLLIIVPYISSIVEPSAPFSPNTIYILHYLFLGIAIRNDYT